MSVATKELILRINWLGKKIEVRVGISWKKYLDNLTLYLADPGLYPKIDRATDTPQNQCNRCIWSHLPMKFCSTDLTWLFISIYSSLLVSSIWVFPNTYPFLKRQDITIIWEILLKVLKFNFLRVLNCFRVITIYKLFYRENLNFNIYFSNLFVG